MINTDTLVFGYYVPNGNPDKLTIALVDKRDGSIHHVSIPATFNSQHTSLVPLNSIEQVDDVILGPKSITKQHSRGSLIQSLRLTLPGDFVIAREEPVVYRNIRISED